MPIGRYSLVIRHPPLLLLILTLGSSASARSVESGPTQAAETPRGVGAATAAIDEAVFAGTYEPNKICVLETGADNCQATDSDLSISRYAEQGDFDQDGHLDVLFWGRICWGTGTGQFLCSPSPLTGLETEVAFLNGDGFPDLVSEEEVCLNSGARSFSCEPHTSVEANQVTSLGSGHVNADTHLDLVFATSEQAEHALMICLGDGTGYFDECSATSMPRLIEHLKVGRFDGDSHGDFLFSTAEGLTKCLGAQARSLSCEVLTGGAISDIELDFVDGDAAIDVLFAARPGRGGVCLGTSTGTFSCEPLLPTSQPASGVAAGHLNSDGHLDVMLSVWDLDRMNQRCLGDGTGQFVCTPFLGTPDVTDVTVDVVVGDFRTSQPILEDGFETGTTDLWN